MGDRGFTLRPEAQRHCLVLRVLTPKECLKTISTEDHSRRLLQQPLGVVAIAQGNIVPSRSA